MLEKEFGFNYLVATINKGNATTSSLITAGYYTKQQNDKLEITAKGYNFFFEYLNKNKKNISNIFLFLCGLLAHLAFTSKIKTDTSCLRDIINNYYKRIINELEQSSNFFKEQLIEFNTDFKSEMERIAFVSSFPFRHMDKTGLWGVGYVMLYLGLYRPIEFAKWFSSTGRKDLQKIYLSFLLCFLNTETFIPKEFLSSDSPLLRIIALLKYYPVLRYNITFDKEFDIENLNGHISSKNPIENLVIYILFFKKTFWAQPNKLIDKNKEKALRVFSNSTFKSFLDQKTFNELYPQLYPHSQWNLLINKLNNEEMKMELMELQIRNLLEQIKKITGMPSKLDILDIEALEQIAVDFPNLNILEHIEHTFNQIQKKILLPYTYFRNYNLWVSSCIQSLLLLIPLHNINKHNEKYSSPFWKDKYCAVKGKYKFYSKELEQLEDEILHRL